MVNSVKIRSTVPRTRRSKGKEKMINEEQKQDIIGILTTPIECSGYSNGKINITRDGAIIRTTQTYWRNKNYPQGLDEDMSDFSIGFYSILYKELLNGKSVLNGDDNLYNDEFAGDTMNSYVTVAKRKSLKEPTEYLNEYKNQYHCLANFWLIPMHIGRTSKYTPDKFKEWSKTSYEYNIEDYMDRFLNLYKWNSLQYKRLYPSYFAKINCIKDFAKVHIFVGSYTSESMEVCNYSNENNDGKDVVDNIKSKIKLRAIAISESKYADELWNYFNELHLCKKTMIK
ncbi:hypothetical protein [Clostridium kluyveri]|uniref:Uncharacterized protein n=1 Tax=Clostridium kluyveri TaxID=1534 RepID=A0A1L5FAD7_CLOKL|nr:hypothetical protein [Clostridium kluyveri]APM39962.1 hypothetical protein BS101_15085 [Clostridium kluyveri]